MVIDGGDLPLLTSPRRYVCQAEIHQPTIDRLQNGSPVFQGRHYHLPSCTSMGVSQTRSRLSVAATSPSVSRSRCSSGRSGSPGDAPMSKRREPVSKSAMRRQSALCSHPSREHNAYHVSRKSQGLVDQAKASCTKRELRGSKRCNQTQRY